MIDKDRAYTDEELLAVYRAQQDSEISDHLMKKYKPLVLQRARAMYLMGGETEDLIQEGMIGLFKAIRDFLPDKETSFRTFAVLCIDRQIYHAVEASNRMKHQPLNSYISLTLENEQEVSADFLEYSAEEIVISQEAANHMEEEIRKRLSAMENKVLSLYLQGEDYQQIAGKLQKPPKSVDNALQRIRTKVRQFLEEKDGGDKK